MPHCQCGDGGFNSLIDCKVTMQGVTVKYLAMLNILGSERFLSAIRECNQCQSRFSKLEK